MASVELSVLLSVLNGGRHLRQALDSIKAQTCSDWECLVADDGSSDETPRILSEYSSSDPRFRVIRHDRPRGLTDSLIELVSLAKSAYLARHDADDWSHPKRFECQLDRLRRRDDVLAVGSSFGIHEDDGSHLDTIVPFQRSWMIRRVLRRRNPLAHGSLIIRRAAYDAVGGYRTFFRFAQDYDLLLRLSEKGLVESIPMVLYHHRLSENGIGRERAAEQRCFAEFAQLFARQRLQGKPESFMPTPSLDGTATYSTERVRAIHLVKSGQRDKADAALARWIPENVREKTERRTLMAINRLPNFVRKRAYDLYRIRELV